MSSEGHARHDHDHDHDDDADDHHAIEAPPDEPESPGWLPLLGGALFLAALVVFLLTRSPEPDPPPQAAPAEAAAEGAAPAPEGAAPAPEGAAPAPARAAPGHEGHDHP
jgi:hypothetical protein